MATACNAVRHVLLRRCFTSSSEAPALRAGVSYSFPSLERRLRFSSSQNSSEEAANASAGAVNSVADAEQIVSTSSVEDLAVQSSPRVANLPEDLSAEQLQKLVAERQLVESDGKAVKEKQQHEEEEPAGYPSLVKAVDGKKRNAAAVLLAEAIREVKTNARARFDETIEAHVRLGIDPRRSDQTVRGAANLPHGCGKVVRVAVFAEGAAADEARSAGADIIGGDELIAEIQESGGKLNFDKCIATPAFMPRLGKVARILGPRGLMPNPKVGSVTNAVGEATRAAKQGRVDFRADKSAIVHVGLGKASFKEEALLENIAAFTTAILAAKPVGLKKASRYAGYLNSFVLTSTMGAGVRVSLPSLVQAADSFAKTVDVR